MNTPANVGLSPVGICTKANITYPVNSGIRLPYTSLSGAHNIGPDAKPITKHEMPSSMMVGVVLNSLEVTAMVALKMELERVTVKVVEARRAVMSHFRGVEREKGSNGGGC
jgi:hypothetical protein